MKRNSFVAAVIAVLGLGLLAAACSSAPSSDAGSEVDAVPSSLPAGETTITLEPSATLAETKSTAPPISDPDSTNFADDSAENDRDVHIVLTDQLGSRPDFSIQVEQVEFQIEDFFDDVRPVRAWVPVGSTSWNFSGVEFSSRDLSIFTSISFDSGCDGICGPKEWEPELTNAEGIIARRRDNLDSVIADEPLQNGWLIHGMDGTDAAISVFRWDDNATFYFECEADIDDDDIAVVDDFVALCLAAEPLWIGV